MTTLSVLVPTCDPPDRVRAAIAPLRAVADEVVVAVDAARTPPDLGPLFAVADRVLRYERGPTHSSLAWLAAQCRGDWLLLLAGDEVVGPALLDALPRLLAARDVQQYALAFRWLHPDGETWLADPPWGLDTHVRLVRNDGTLRFAGRKHELVRPTLPTRTLELPLWHLNLVLLDEAERRAKAARNAAERPGSLTAEGRPLDATVYLPEDTPAARREPVPPAELAAIRAVLAAPPSGAPPVAPADVPLARRAEIEPRWAGREVGPGAYRARVVPVVERVEARAGVAREVLVRVRNEGDCVWPWGLDLPPLIRLGLRWPGGGAPEGRAPFTHDVVPGDETVVPVAFTAPAAPGRHVLEVDVVHEDVRWFGAPGRVLVDVRA